MRSLGKKVIVFSAIAAVASMFLGWAQGFFFSRSGLQLSLLFLLVFWVYPLAAISFNRLINVKLGNLIALGGVVGALIVMVVISSKSGFFVSVHPGLGALLFLVAGIALWIGINLYARAGPKKNLAVNTVKDIELKGEAPTALGASMKEESSRGKLASVGKTLATLYGRLTGGAVRSPAHSDNHTDQGEHDLPKQGAHLAAITSLESRVLNAESMLADLQNGLAESLSLGRRVLSDQEALVLQFEAYQAKIHTLTIGLALSLLLSFILLTLSLLR